MESQLSTQAYIKVYNFKFMNPELKNVLYKEVFERYSLSVGKIKFKIADFILI